MQSPTTRIVAIGGGHCNCQMLKLLKKKVQDSAAPMTMTLINESAVSYYSGMLPGTVSKLYTDEDLKIELAPLAEWCGAKYIQERVTKIEGDKNLIHLENGETVEYDVLAVNVGSKTKDTGNIKGVWEHALTTRPINDLIPKIIKKEQELKEKGVIPTVVICGGGAAGTELSFAFKKRWSEFFGQDIKVTLLASREEPVHTEVRQTKDQINRKLKDKGVEVITNVHVKEVTPTSVILTDDTVLSCDVAVWATGAEPQKVSTESDLDLMKGFFRVNNFLQSTSHPNIFAGGDCITMESYVDKPYPTKAGVYAVRAGPIIAENVVKYIEKQPLKEYVPQSGFLSLMMTADGNCIGSKHGIGFVGKWVWGLKDYIDMGFMNLFNPKYLFKDYATQGTKEPIEDFSLFDDIDANVNLKAIIAEHKTKAFEMDAKQAADLLACSEDTEFFHDKWQVLSRMHNDAEFTAEVVKHFKPEYAK